MELHLEDQNPAGDAAEAAPVRRRASRRVSAAAGAAAEVAADVAVTVSEAPAAAQAADATAAPATAPAAEAEAAPEKAAPKRASRSRKKVEPAEAPAAEAEAAAGTEAPAAKSEETPAAQAEAAGEPAAEAPKKRATRSRKAATAEPTAEAAEQATDAAAETAGDAAPAGKAASTRASSAKGADAKAAAAKDADAKGTEANDADAPQAADADAKPAVSDAADSSDDADAQPARRSRRRANQAAEQADADTQGASDDSRSRGRGGNQNGAKNDGAKSDSTKGDSSKSEGSKSDAAKGDGEQGQGDRQGQGDANKQENGSRSSRTRQRDRKRRGGDDLELEIAEDDVLLPVAGILDVLDNYAFVRTSGYLPGVSDVYVALGQVKKYSLRRGDAIVGAIRQPREGDSGGRQKYNAIVKIDSVNGKPVDEAETRSDITEMTAIFPEQPLRFGTGKADSIGAKIDEHAPMGLGQRAIVALPAAIPATRVLSELAAAVTANAPAAHLLVVLTNARPEEATYLERTVSGEVIAATFDRAVEDQATVAELAIDRASRLVELGHDVVVLLDSLTDLAHAYLQNQQGARSTPEAAQALAVAQAKRLLGSARNLENGGSLTLLATARTHTGVASDKDLLRELTPAANSFVKISGSRTAPEVNAQKSYTISF